MKTITPLASAEFPSSGIRVSGSFGFPYLGGSDIADVRLEDGVWIHPKFGSANPVTGLPAMAPPNSSKVRGEAWQVLAHNEYLTALRLHIPNAQPAALKAATAEPTARPPMLYAAATGRWQRLDGFGSEAIIRAIGPWLLLIAGEEQRGRQSPGEANRRPSPVGRYSNEQLPRPNSRDRFGAGAVAYYPGRLVAMDTRNGKTWQVVTNQGDSEPLLVDGTTLYYRVNDRILKAELSANGAVGAPVLLAQHDDLRDAHWAFLGPAQ